MLSVKGKLILKPLKHVKHLHTKNITFLIKFFCEFFLNYPASLIEFGVAYYEHHLSEII